MNPFMILFLLLAVLILFGAHYLIWSAAARFFALSILTKKILALALGFLMISFVLSSLLAHYWQNNPFVKMFYGVAGFWLGWMINLLLAVAVGWFLIWVLRFLGFNPNKMVIGASLFSLALIVAVYGVWNAFNPVVRNISVKIKALPAQWQGKKIVMVSDVHLGHIYRPDFMAKMAQNINAQNPEMILIDGDLFDGIDGETLNGFIEPLGRLEAPRGVYFVTGNHETYLGVEKAKAILGQTKIQVLNDEIKLIDNLQLIGISYPTVNTLNRDVAAAVKAAGYNSDLPSILMYHQPTNIADAKRLGIDLQLAGHTHNGQLWPINYIVRLIFKGYEYGLHVEGDYNEYTSSGLGTWGPPMRTSGHGEIVVINLQ